jgi:hypothetical protein
VEDHEQNAIPNQPIRKIEAAEPVIMQTTKSIVRDAELGGDLPKRTRIHAIRSQAVARLFRPGWRSLIFLSTTTWKTIKRLPRVDREEDADSRPML